MDDRVALRSADALADIKSVSKTLIDGWTAIHNEMLGKRVSSNLSVREWQAARLAAYGLQNKEIADIMGVTVNAVKQALRMAMDKTGCESRDELSQYI
jgi:DNA-binding CsgD family transcriptional regulator